MKDNLIQTIGASLRDLRIKQRISQKTLSQGICTQSYISMIEKGDIAPSAHILHAFSLRLGVDISYFFDSYDSNMYENIAEFKSQVRRATENNDFKEVASLISSQTDNPYFRTTKMKKFIHYHQGLCEYYLERNADRALHTLQNILENEPLHDDTFFQEDLETLLSIAVIYSEEQQWQEAGLYFQKSLTLLARRPRINESILGLRVYYNYVRYLYSMEEFENVIHYGKKTAKLCSNLKTIYLHGESYYYIGLAYLKLSDFQNGEHALTKSEDIFKVTDQQGYIEQIHDIKGKFSIG